MSNTILFNCLLIKILIFNVYGIITVVDKGLSPLENNSVAIRFYIDFENENRNGTCKVCSRVNKCCLTDPDKEDCEIMHVVGDTAEYIKPKDRKTFTYVYPTLAQYDLVGYCNIILDYHCPRNRDRILVDIPFDTRISQKGHHNSIMKNSLSNSKYVTCKSLDQNSLDNCFPINCDLKYTGQRPFYDGSINKCIKAPICVGNINKELPTVVYVPQLNLCKNLDLPLTVQDIYALTTGLGVVNQSTKKEEDVKAELQSNCSTISENLYLLKDLMYGKLCPCDKATNINFENNCKSAVFAIVFCVISICAVFLSFFLCVNTTVWVHRQWSEGNINAFMVRVKSKFKRSENKRYRSRINSEIRNNLLREVIVKDIPLELRDSVVSICDRMEKDVRKKKRYRNEDIGSQISLKRGNTVTSSSSTDTLCSEKEKLLK